MVVIWGASAPLFFALLCMSTNVSIFRRFVYTCQQTCTFCMLLSIKLQIRLPA